MTMTTSAPAATSTTATDALADGRVALAALASALASRVTDQPSCQLVLGPRHSGLTIEHGVMVAFTSLSLPDKVIVVATAKDGTTYGVAASKGCLCLRPKQGPWRQFDLKALTRTEEVESLKAAVAKALAGLPAA